jgi:hypothetical protein
MTFLDRIRAWIGGRPTPHNEHASTKTARDPITLVKHLADGGLRRLSDAELAQLLGVLLGDPGYRVPLRGNAKFLESVERQYRRNGLLSYKQRQAIYNVLERAYPHNLVVERGRFGRA